MEHLGYTEVEKLDFFFVMHLLLLFSGQWSSEQESLPLQRTETERSPLSHALFVSHGASP
jgi:hypothetical protein